MSIDTCDSCGDEIKAHDFECYVTIADKLIICLCPSCREQREDDDAVPEKDEPHNVSVGEAAAEYAWRKSL